MNTIKQPSTINRQPTIHPKLAKINQEACEAISKSLSQLIEEEVKVQMIKAEIHDIKEISLAYEKEELVAAIYCPVGGDLQGAGLLFFSKEEASVFSDLLVKRHLGTVQKLTLLDQSVLEEAGNILSSGYFNTLGNSLQVDLIQEAPQFSLGMFGAILEQAIANFIQVVPQGLIVEVAIEIQSHTIRSYFLLLFETKQLETILGALEK